MFLDGHAHTHAPQSLARALPLSRFLSLSDKTPQYRGCRRLLLECVLEQRSLPPGFGFCRGTVCPSVELLCASNSHENA